MKEPSLVTFDFTPYFKREETIVLAVSGGVDSMVLFDILYKQKQSLVVAHVNHRKRSESDQEYTWLKSYCDSKGVVFEGFVLPDDIKGNFQEEARNYRLSFFKTVAKQHSAKKIILAHHLDDQVELFFMRLVKGSPLENLSSTAKLTEMDGVILVRPFLDVPKKALLNYGENEKLTYWEDHSNCDLSYTRNRFRHEIIPSMAQENPQFLEAIGAHLTHLEDAIDLIQERANDFLRTKEPSFEVAEFLKLNPLVQSAILHRLIQDCSSVPIRISKQLLTQILAFLKYHKKNIAHSIDDKVIFRLEYGKFHFEKIDNHPPKVMKITSCGTFPYDAETSFVISHEKCAHIASNCLVLCYNDEVFPLYIRTKKPGDSISLSYGRKKIKDLLIDKKIPPSQRDNILLLTNDKEVLWIPFFKMTKHPNNLPNKLYICEVKNYES